MKSLNRTKKSFKWRRSEVVVINPDRSYINIPIIYHVSQLYPNYIISEFLSQFLSQLSLSIPCKSPKKKPMLWLLLPSPITWAAPQPRHQVIPLARPSLASGIMIPPVFWCFGCQFYQNIYTKNMMFYSWFDTKNVSLILCMHNYI